MNILEKAREKLVLQPLAEYLINMNKATGTPQLRDNYMYRNGNQYAANRTKGGGTVSYDTLRRFSVQYDVARACINRRKRQLNQIPWNVVPYDETDKSDKILKRAEEVKRAFSTIGGYRVRFRECIDLMVEDLLVLDAVAAEKIKDRGGAFHSLNIIDSSTIRLAVTESGGTPMPPDPAYKQIIRGQQTATWTADEMYYEMMNPRTNTPYGLAPLETLILGVSTALKSDVYNMHMLTEGNIPEGLFSVPDTWQPNQIKEFQQMWDAAMEGNTLETSKLRFVPQGSYQPTKKPEDMRFKELQEWLMQKTCMLFEIAPEQLGFTKTVNRATAETQQNENENVGLAPLARFFEEIFTDIIQVDMGYPDLKFRYTGLDHRDEKATAETNQILIQSGQRTPDEVRAQDGLAPLGGGASKLMITSGTVTFLDEESMKMRADAAEAAKNQPEVDPADENTDEEPKDPAATDDTKKAADPVALGTELRAFRKYAVAKKTAGKEMRPFVSKILPQMVTDELNDRVAKAADPEAVRGIFKEFMQDYQIEFLANVVELRKDLERVV